jgi:DNA-binding transcriptional MerR regulator
VPDRYLLGCLPVSPDWMLRPAEAATLAGVSAQTIRNWERSGKLGDDGVEITKGGQRRYRAGAIIAVLEGKPQ